MPTRATSTTTSSGPGSGSGTSCTSDRPGPVRTRACTSAWRDHVRTLATQTVDAQLDDVTGSEPDRRVETEPDAGRGAGVDQVARLQHHELAEVVDDEVGVEDHRC